MVLATTGARRYDRDSACHVIGISVMGWVPMESKNKQKLVRLTSVMVSPYYVKWTIGCDVDKVTFEHLQEPDI